MLRTKSYEYDCTKKCCLRAHGNRITAALTKRSISDEHLATFIAKTCANFQNNHDDLGRIALHMAASVDRYALLEWLLNQGSFINMRDFESGNTALHRAIYYGCIDCAVCLLKYGASLDVLDEDTRAPLQNVCRLSDLRSRKEVPSLNDLLVWGCNKNYNLGIDNDSDTSLPQSVEYFRKEHIVIESLVLGAYHSLFLDKKSRLYAVGHGNGGRLGNGNEHSQPRPKKVKVPIKNTEDYIISISASRIHSLILTKFSAVFACGLNDHRQLGVRDAGEKLTVFKEVVTLRDLGVENLVGVIAREGHSLAYSENCIYCWGTNHGQMNLDDKVKVAPLPKLMRLPPRTQINFVESNDCATVVVNKDNVVLLFYNYKMRSLKPPNYEAIKSISVIGGDNAKFAKGTVTALKLLMLTQTNVIFLWYEMKQQFFRCIFSHIRLSQIDKIFYNANQVLILSQGDVYQGKCNQIPIPAYARNDDGFSMKKSIKSKASSGGSNIWSRWDNNQTEVSQEFMIRIELQRLVHIDRAVNIFCNNEFSSFAVLQESSMKYFKITNLPTEEYAFKKLYNDADIFDAVHDLVFHVDSETFAAHKYIVHARAPGLKDIICDFPDKDIYLNFDRLSGKMFELMLKFIYMNYLPNESDLEDIQTSLGPDSPEELIETCELFLNFVEQFRMNPLAYYLKSFLQQSPFYLPQLPDKSKFRFNRLRLTDFPELYDVSIACANDVIIRAHKCILVARLEYFEMMFSHTWAEQNLINLSTVPAEYMTPIIEFLYSADADGFRKQNYNETYLYNMVVYCDQFLIERLRKVCEILILEKISIRKCGNMLEFACMYNCEILKNGCTEFICQNLSRVLNVRVLEQCEPETLKCINQHYRNMFKDIFDYRMITPDADAVDDDLLLSFVDDFHIDWEYRMNEEELEEFLQKSAAKTKFKEHKKSQQQGARQYERDVISSMIASLKLARNTENNVKNEKSEALLAAQRASEKLQADAKAWMKVVDKKDQKKKSALENALKVNEVLKNEDKPKTNYVALEKPTSSDILRKSTEKESLSYGTTSAMMTTPIKSSNLTTAPTPTKNNSSGKAYNFNLGDLKATPTREKLSQKQRKRISSNSDAANTAGTLAKLMEPTAAIAVPVAAIQPNAWGVLPQSPPSQFYTDSPPLTGSSADPTSFASIANTGARRRSGNSASGSTPQSANNSFSQILEDERRQRDYYERMRNKSLALTQIEEQAIAELREFYNADNAVDEVITVERRPVPRTMDFTVWRHS